MRQLASFLLIALVLPAAAAETWRWKDANGVVHYSDRPVPGAERVNLGPASGPASQQGSVPEAVASTPPASAPDTYSRCIVLAPVRDEVFNMVNSVTATLQVTPTLQVGHRLRVLYDGVAHAEWPDRQLSYTLMNVYRGTHTLAVQVVDADGRTLCSGPATTFHVRQASIFSPARQPAARP